MVEALSTADELLGKRARIALAIRRCVGVGSTPLGGALIIGLILRYLLAPFTAWPHDDVVWFQATVAGQHQLGLYALSEFPYPPLWGLLLEGLGQAIGHLGLSSPSLAAANSSFTALNRSTQDYADVITTPIFNLLYKTILFAFDIGAGMLIRQAVRDLTGDQKRSDFAFALWFLNPFVLFESAMFGGFDVINAFFILATIVLIFHRQYAWAGVALGLGLVTKLSPIFLLPLLAVVVAEPQRRGFLVRINLRYLGAFAAGILVSTIAVLAPVVAGGDGPAALHSALARVGSGISVGGLSVFGISTFNLFSWIPAWASLHASAVILGTSLAAALGSLAVALVVLGWAKRDRIYSLVSGVLLVFAILLITQPVTQPQYLLWMMPELVLLIAIWDRARLPTAILSITPLVYVYSLLGPLAVLAPLSVATGFMAPNAVASRTLNWYLEPTNLWGVNRGGDFSSVAAALTVLALIVLIVTIVRHAPGGTNAIAERLSTPVVRRDVAATVCGVAGAAAVLGGLAAYRPTPLPHSAASMAVYGAKVEASSVSLRISVTPGPGQSAIRLVAFPISAIPPPRRIVVFVDAAYPGPDSDFIAVQGVFDHLGADLRARRYAGGVSEVNTAGLATVLRGFLQAKTTTIVMTAGVMPASIFSRDADLVTPWLAAGGTLIWSGDAIGYYSEGPSAAFDVTFPGSLRGAGPSRILGPGLIHLGKVAGRLATTPSPVAAALGLSFDSTAIAVEETAVEARHGRVLGFTSNGLSSISSVPVGLGNVIILSGDSYNEELISHDVSLLIVSQAAQSVGGVVSENLSAVPGTVTWNVPLQVNAGTTILVEAFDPGIEGVAFVRRWVTAG